MPRRLWTALSYAIAPLSVAAAVSVRAALDQYLAYRFPFAFLFVAVAISAAYGGWGPAVLATALGYVALCSTLLPSRHGLPIGVGNQIGIGIYLLVCLSITALSELMRAAQRRARWSERRLRLITAVMPQQVWAVDTHGRVEYCNERILAYTGLTFDEICGGAWRTMLHPDDKSRLKALWERAVQERGEFHAELRLRAVDGSYRWFLARALPLHDEQGRILRWYGTNTDIQDRKQAEHEREQAMADAQRQAREADKGRRVLQALMEHIPMGIRIADAQGATIGLSRWGRTSDASAVFRADGVTPATQEEMPLTRAIRYGDIIREEEWVIKRPDGSPMSVLCTAAPICDADGRPTGAVVGWQDITDRKRLEQALQQRIAELDDADRRKDEFLAMLGHELRNPLAPIRNAARILRITGPTKPEYVEWARDIIDRQVDHLTHLVDDLLEVSRITRGKIVLRRKPMSLNAAVASAVETVRPLIDERRQQLHTTLPPEPVWIDGDATRITQVLTNLLNNAAKYTEERGSIALSLERSGTDVVIKVRDTGIGIPSDVLPHVFDLFRQADRSVDRAQGGLGIGLTLVRSLVEMHGGSVHAASPGAGRGSEFVVRLPALQQPPMDAAAADTRAAPAASLAAHRILVVDDNHDAADSLAMLLRLSGHDVLAVHDGFAALETAPTFQPEIVFLDIGLPGMDGYEVARRLRRSFDRELLLVALTGYGQGDDRRRSEQAGFDYHLVKPVVPDVMNELLASVDATHAVTPT